MRMPLSLNELSRVRDIRDMLHFVILGYVVRDRLYKELSQKTTNRIHERILLFEYKVQSRSNMYDTGNYDLRTDLHTAALYNLVLNLF